MSTVIQLSASVLRQVETHLFPPGSGLEQGGFLFCRARQSGVAFTFEAMEWAPLPASDYVEQETDYLELTDASRARLIKHAHDLGASMVEVHSHPGSYPAMFSYSDLTGLREFAPHVLWRLKGKPYAAVVFACSGFDGLAWQASAEGFHQIDEIVTESERWPATGLTMKKMSGVGYE